MIFALFHSLCTSSVRGSFHRKDSWRERRTQHARRRNSIASDAALAGRLPLSVLLPLGQFQKMRAQLPRKLLVPRVDVVRKCLLTSSGQEQANKTTRRPPLNVFVAEGEDSCQSKFASCFHESLIFTFQEHRAADTVRSSDESIGEFGKRFDGRHTGGFDVHEGMCAVSSCVTRAWQSHHDWQLRRLLLKGESLDVRDACEQCGNVGGRQFVFCISMPLVSCVSAVFLVVGLVCV